MVILNNIKYIEKFIISIDFNRVQAPPQQNPNESTAVINQYLRTSSLLNECFENKNLKTYQNENNSNNNNNIMMNNNFNNNSNANNRSNLEFLLMMLKNSLSYPNNEYERVVHQAKLLNYLANNQKQFSAMLYNSNRPTQNNNINNNFGQNNYLNTSKFKLKLILYFILRT